MTTKEQLERPAKVTTSIKFLYASLGMGLIRMIIDTAAMIIESASPEDTGRAIVFLFIMLFILALKWLLFNIISKGKDWARITYLAIFFLFGVPSITTIIRSFTNDPMPNIISIGQFVLQAIALVLLFQRTSSAWFYAVEHSKTKDAQPGIQPDR